MHLAAWLGAAQIVLVGADCGTLDGEHRVVGYQDGTFYNAYLDQAIDVSQQELRQKPAAQ